MPKTISYHHYRKSRNRGTTIDPRSHSRDMEIPENSMDRSKRNSSWKGHPNQSSYQRCLLCSNYSLV
eukprot:scaffold315_cov32-Attheya_sp.AAC.4